MATETNKGIRRGTKALPGAAPVDEATRKVREHQWLGENRAAIGAWNDYIVKNGLPLARFRQF